MARTRKRVLATVEPQAGGATPASGDLGPRALDLAGSCERYGRDLPHRGRLYEVPSSDVKVVTARG